MSNFELHPADVRHEIYLKRKAISDELRLKAIHFYNEVRSSKLGTAIGHIRKYTTQKASKLHSYLSGNSRTLSLIALSNAFDSTTATDVSLGDSIDWSVHSDPALLPRHLNSEFSATPEFVSAAVAQEIEAADTQNFVAKRDIANITNETFIGPLDETFKAALDAAATAQDRAAVAADFILPARHTDGIHRIGDQFAVTAQRLETLRSQFDSLVPTDVGETFRVLRLDPLTRVTSVVPPEPVETRQPAPIIA